MSSQRGNVSRTRAPKHKNTFAFKNNMHDKTKKTQDINNIVVSGCCEKCKDVIEWKIKYKKYKPLTVPKKCTKCNMKTIKRAYTMMCEPCGKKLDMCIKCGQKKDIVIRHQHSAAEELALQAQFNDDLKFLPERKRRTFLRLNASGKLKNIDGDEIDTDSDDEGENTSICSSKSDIIEHSAAGVQQNECDQCDTSLNDEIDRDKIEELASELALEASLS